MTGRATVQRLDDGVVLVEARFDRVGGGVARVLRRPTPEEVEAAIAYCEARVSVVDALEEARVGGAVVTGGGEA